MTIAIALIIGIIIGFLIARALKSKTTSIGSITKERSSNKEENKQKIIAYLKERGEGRNGDFQNLVGVSDWSITKYMDELEEEGIVEQVGSTGRGVSYRLK